MMHQMYDSDVLETWSGEVLCRHILKIGELQKLRQDNGSPHA